MTSPQKDVAIIMGSSSDLLHGKAVEVLKDFEISYEKLHLPEPEFSKNL